MSDYSTNAFANTGARGSIHGRIYWDNGRHTDFIYARIVNGEERKADYIMIDGERYERVMECENVDRHPFVRFKCSECGCLVYFEDIDGEPWMQVDGVAETLRFCPLCGAKAVSA